MKRALIFLLVLLLSLTGCAGRGKVKNVSVKDGGYPYTINHKKNAVEITLQDSKQSGVLWQVEAIPDDICEVAQENIDNEDTCRYYVSGKREGAAQLTFTALDSDETACFVLTVVANVDANGKTVISAYQHQESEEVSVDADGLRYNWNVDLDGNLNFSFINDEDRWYVLEDGADVFVLTNAMSTPSGCEFSAQAHTTGQDTIVIVSDTAQRTIHVVIQADDDGKMEVVSVQEQ